MNERIKELAVQAEYYAEYTTPQGLEWLPTFKEKFAELIIEECELAFWSEECRVSDLAYEEYCTNCRKIQEHFKDSNAST